MRIFPYLPRLSRGIGILVLAAFLMPLFAPASSVQAQTSGRIDGIVFQDLNTNTVRDPFEPGLAGVVITLRDADNQDIATTLSDANGAFTFNPVEPGVYTVVKTPLAGYVSTTPDQVAVSLGAGETANVAFGNRRTTTSVTPPSGYVWGFVIDDRNANGKADPGEPGLPGVTVQLIDASGNLVATVVTDQNGFYDFGERPEGEYTVKFTPPAGTNATTPTAVEIDVTNGGLLTFIFGAREPFPLFMPIVGRQPSE